MIALTAPKGAMAIIIVEFFIGLFVEIAGLCTVQSKQQAEERQLAQKKKQDEKLVYNDINKKKEEMKNKTEKELEEM